MITQPYWFTKGSIFHLMEPDLNREDVNSICQAMTSAQGPGNSHSLFMCSPNGKKDGIQSPPLSDVAAKDEFLNMKDVSWDDIMTAHRIQPQMMGIMSHNVGGLGDVENSSMVFARNELIPLQKKLEMINQWGGEYIIELTIISWSKYTPLRLIRTIQFINKLPVIYVTPNDI